MSLDHFGHGVYVEIAAERERAHAKHGRNSMESKPVDSLIRYTILAEEVGEVAKEFNEAEIRGGLMRPYRCGAHWHVGHFHPTSKTKPKTKPRRNR